MILRTVGAVSIVLVSFVIALLALDLFDTDVIRKKNARAIAAALERYYEAKGSYPILPIRDSPVTLLAGSLVAGGFISEIPADPAGAEPTHYFSNDGKSFGLWLHFKGAPPCKITVRDPGKGWWGDAPYCGGTGSFGW